MSEVEAAVPLSSASMAERLAGEVQTEVTPVDEPDTSGTPGEAVDLEAGDGPLAANEAGDETSDTDDGTPDDDEPGDGGFEKRFKDTQAELTEKSQALVAKTKEFDDFKADYAKQIDAITQSEQQAQDYLQMAQHVSASILGPIQQRLQQLGQVNAQTLPQDQYGKWQQEVSFLQGWANHFGQMAEHAKQQYAGMKKHSDDRMLQHSGKVLSVLIPDFNEVKSDMVEHARSLGWPESTIYSVQDPHILRLLKDSMDLAKSPDAIEEVSRKKPAPVRPPNSGNPQGRPKPKSLAERMYGSNP